MITKRVNRYYCEHCKKANCSAASISRHEKACTMNPNRACRMCAMRNLEQREMSDLLVILPNPNIIENDDILTLTNVGEVEEKMGELREATEGCPACILATLRQKEIPVPAISSFNFTEECNEWWSLFNEETY